MTSITNIKNLIDASHLCSKNEMQKIDLNCKT